MRKNLEWIVENYPFEFKEDNVIFHVYGKDFKGDDIAIEYDEKENKYILRRTGETVEYLDTEFEDMLSYIEYILEPNSDSWLE